jgi:DNA invertase Pin-like site-specific DNA recombinase
MRSCVPYYRVSTDQQGESKLGLEAQQIAVRKYAASLGLNLAKEFTEIESGKKNNRPVLLEALAYCKKHKALLLIATLDRLARNVAFISSLMESSIEFIVVDNPSASKILLHMLAVFAEHERDQISQRTKKALLAARMRGIVLGKYGKVLSQRNKQEAFEFAIRLKPTIERLKSEGFKSIRSLVKELNRRKIPTFRRGKWHYTTVRHLLCRINKKM